MENNLHVLNNKLNVHGRPSNALGKKYCAKIFTGFVKLYTDLIGSKQKSVLY